MGEERGCETGSCTGYCAAGNPCASQGFDCTCAAGQTYQGRGPVQLSWNYNYGAFSKYIYGDASVLINDPSQVATNATDTAVGRVPGYGMTTNIINGGLECNMPTNSKVVDRVEYYKRYAGVLNVAVEEATLYCDQMVSYR